MKTIFIVIIVSLFVGCVFLNHKSLSLNEALKLANKKVAELKYDPNKMKIIYDNENSFWNKYIKEAHYFENNPELRKVFSNRQYWVFIYLPTGKMTVDGNVDVFIDKITGKIFMINEGVTPIFY